MNWFSGFIKKDELISIFLREEDDYEFDIGRVIAFSEKFLLVRQFDRFGVLDSIGLYNIDYISKIEKNTLYLKEMQELYDLKSSEVISVEKDLLKWFCDYSQNRVVFFKLDGMDDLERGIIKKISEDSIIIANVVMEGRPDGEAIFLIDDVELMCVDGKSEKKLEKINQWIT